MNSDIFWGVFENTGSIEAFLTYYKSEEISSDTYEIAGATNRRERAKKLPRKNNKIRFILQEKAKRYSLAIS